MRHFDGKTAVMVVLLIIILSSLCSMACDKKRRAIEEEMGPERYMQLRDSLETALGRAPYEMEVINEYEFCIKRE